MTLVKVTRGYYLGNTEYNDLIDGNMSFYGPVAKVGGGEARTVEQGRKPTPPGNSWPSDAKYSSGSRNLLKTGYNLHYT